MAGAVTIPPYPSIALRLQALVDEGNFGLADLARIAGYYRGSSRLTALPDAISRIGAQELCKVALAAALGTSTSGPGPLAALRRATWRQALGSALVSQVLAPIRRLGAQQGFLCGLLHDFGRVVALACLEEVLANQPPGQLAEEDWLGIVDRLHVELGTLVAARWNLPELLVEVIAGHHLPPVPGNARAFIDLVCTADEVVALLEDCPYLLRSDFDGAASLRSAQEAEVLMQYIPLIPGYISGLEDLGAIAGAQGKSAVEQPETVLGHPRLEVDFPLVWVRSSGETTFRARYVTAKGIGFSGRASMHEGSVARLRVSADELPVDLSGRVVLCRPEDHQNLVEVCLFALPGPAQSWWSALAAAAVEPPV